jgi:hypothetical protein
MSFKIDLTGQLMIGSDTPFANLEFNGDEINIQIEKNSLFLPHLGGLRSIRKLFIEFSEWVFELGLTLKVHIKEKLIMVIGEKAKPKKIVSIISGNHVEVKDTKAVISLVRGM